MPLESPPTSPDDFLPGNGQFEDCVTQALAATIHQSQGLPAAQLPAIAELLRCVVDCAAQAQAHEVHLDTDVSVGLTQIFFRVDADLVPFAWLPTRLRDPLIDHLLVMAGFDPGDWPAPEHAALTLRDASRWHLSVVPTDEGMRDAILRRATT